MRSRLEYALVWTLIRAIGALPPSLARALGRGIGALAFRTTPRLRRVGEINLSLAYPGFSAAQRMAVLRKLYGHLGELLAEFCLMPRYTAAGVEGWIRCEGLEHYLTAQAQGKGVLVLTGHLGAWELSSFYFSLIGYPMGIVIRRLDNPLVDRLVDRIRCMHGNRTLHKDDFARGLLASMRAGETVGILMDTNMTPPQGVFVDFFGRLACTATGLARVAMKTGSAILPGFMVWEAEERKYVLRFGEPVALIQTGEEETDLVRNTALLTQIIESYVRRYPEQWLWVHRRWKTRPAGEPPIY